MTNALQTTDRTATFQAIAADRMISAAKMTLHELVDEYQRLSKIIADNTVPREDDEDYGPVEYTDAGAIAVGERNIILAASRARFGIAFEPYSMV